MTDVDYFTVTIFLGGDGGGGGWGRRYALIAWPLRECASERGMVFVISVLNRVYNFMRVTIELICLMKFVFAPICKSNDYNANFFNLQLSINDFKTRKRSFRRFS